MYDNIEFIICAAGECTRNFPHAKGIAHKALLPMGDMRIIDYTLQDIVRMGGRHITIVCSNQSAIDSFKKALALDSETENKLRNKGKDELADILHNTFLPEDTDLKFVIQQEPLGTGHVIYVAKEAIQDRHAVLIFPDDLIFSKDPQNPHIKRLVDTFLQDPKKVLPTGIWRPDVTNNAVMIGPRIIEKPKDPPNNIACYSPITLPKECVQFLIKQGSQRIYDAQNNHKEWSYTDSVNDFLDQGGETLGFKIEVFSKSDDDAILDTGNLALYEQCLLEMLLKHSHYKEQNREHILKLLNQS